MLWDVFCRVIDNFGDIGVCWRLAADLGQRGQEVRLWVDDASALEWMAPQVQWQVDAATGLSAGAGQPGVQVMRWQDAQRDVSELPGLHVGDVVIEAFGCDPPDAFVARMARQACEAGASGGQVRQVQWVNLEYLSAEDYVERSHGLRSPVWSGPGAGLSKRFFYPGFTRATGGLLREPDLIGQRLSAFGTLGARQAFLGALGVPQTSLTSPESSGLPRSIRPVVLVFCYDTAPLADLLDRLDDAPNPALVLLTPGPATLSGQAWLAGRAAVPGLALHTLPALSQADFDRLLWCTDLNFVRGEDSAVRALWAGKPHIWQIYEQDDGVHAAKLDAFMHRWMATWPDDLRADVAAWWRAWNRLGPMPQTLPDWRDAQAAWPRASASARADLLAQNDLCSQLLDFVTSSG